MPIGQGRPDRPADLDVNAILWYRFSDGDSDQTYFGQRRSQILGRDRPNCAVIWASSLEVSKLG